MTPKDRVGNGIGYYTNNGVDDTRDSSAKITVTQTNLTFDVDDDNDRQLQPPFSYYGSTPPSQLFRKPENIVKDSASNLQNESKVLVIYTGGTIGMIRNNENGKRKIIMLRILYTFRVSLINHAGSSRRLLKFYNPKFNFIIRRSYIIYWILRPI